MKTEQNKSNGFIKLFRSFKNWEWYDNANVMRLFLHCLLSANHTDNKWHGIVIKSGSFVTSYPKLAQELRLTNQQIRTSINKLKSTGEITHKSTAQYSIITLNNWDSYQENNSQFNSQATGYQQTNNSQVTPNKNDKNDNNEKNDKNILLLEQKTKKTDTYINPNKTLFENEYKRIFGKRLFLSNQDCLKIVELAANYSDFKSILPIALEKLKNIDFKDINFTPSASWLLKENNFERVMNDEFSKDTEKDREEMWENVRIELEKKGII